MGIFDSKEDVLEIQLTQYGKRKLAAGTLLPAFYAFCDDDILYDTDHANFSENSGEAVDRIVLETPRPNVQSLFHGIETEYKNNSEVQNATEYNSISSLGTSQYNNKYKPAWQLQMESAEINNVVRILTGSNTGLSIPQVNLKDVVYEVNFIKGISSEIKEQLEYQSYENSVLDNEIEELSDGTIVEVVNEDIFINLDEINSVFKNDNFEIELFLVEEKSISSSSNPDAQVKEVLTPLNFQQRNFKRNEIYDDEEFFNNSFDEELTPSDIEYYFNVQSDYEIPNDIFCKYIPQDRRQGVYGKYRKCPEQEVVLVKDYVSDAPVDMEDCDD